MTIRPHERYATRGSPSQFCSMRETSADSIAIGNNDVDRIVQKCVAHNLSERYPSVSELIADVENLDVPAHSISGSGDEA